MLQLVYEGKVGFAQFERSEVTVVTMLQVGCEKMVGLARLERLQPRHGETPGSALDHAGHIAFDDGLHAAHI